MIQTTADGANATTTSGEIWAQDSTCTSLYASMLQRVEFLSGQCYPSLRVHMAHYCMRGRLDERQKAQATVRASLIINASYHVKSLCNAPTKEHVGKVS